MVTSKIKLPKYSLSLRKTWLNSKKNFKRWKISSTRTGKSRISMKMTLKNLEKTIKSKRKMWQVIISTLEIASWRPFRIFRVKIYSLSSISIFTRTMKSSGLGSKAGASKVSFSSSLGGSIGIQPISWSVRQASWEQVIRAKRWTRRSSQQNLKIFRNGSKRWERPSLRTI